MSTAAEGVGGFEVAALELAVEIVDALLAADPFGLLAEGIALGRKRGRDVQQLGRLGGPADRPQATCNLDQPVDHRRMRQY
jgi:hypothetical protein